MSCGNSDILALIDYFQNGTDLSNNEWDNYNYFDLWNAIENGTTPPERTVCATFVQADIRSIVFAVLGVFTSPSDYLGENIDFYYLYLKAIGQEVVSPSFGNFCIGQLYNLFSIGLTAKFRQGQNFECTMSKVAAIASITFEQGQQLDALLSKSVALQQVVFEQQQEFNVDLTTFTGLLDDYPNAAAAYSVRLLSSTYSGPLVRIRKETGGNPEKDFYADSNNELSLSSGDGGGTTLGSWIGSNNGYIVTWYDQSGSNNDATQSSASAQPQILSSGSLITMGGASKAAIEGSTSSLALTTALTPTNFSIIHTSEGSGFLADINEYIRISNYYRYNIVGNNYISSDSNALQQSLYVGNRNGTSLNLRRNGSEMLSSPFTSVTNALNVTTIFNRIGSYFVGKISEFIIYESNQSSNISGIETNINDYFNIYT